MCRELRTLAMYLPQFHRTPENDEWWGEGFTEWTAVKNAKPLFEGHIQPRIPLDDRYYDLTNKETMVWQAQLAEKYGIDGFCFYHYWFKDGRKVLEKPAELLHEWKDINMPFCFSWATATWARSWTSIPGKNSWADKYENQADVDTKSGLLIEQKFGQEQEWEEHFLYLLDFFRDDRYITLDGKPVFVFDASGGMPCIERMIRFWRRLATDNGLPGLYLIAMNTGNLSEGTVDAVIAPMNIKKLLDKEYQGGVFRVSYDNAYDSYLNEIPHGIGQPLLWGMVDYDDTPRRGNKGICFTGATPERFEFYLRKLMEKSRHIDAPFLFINAWNEWGEGMYLEPDESNGFGYLEAFKKACECDEADWHVEPEQMKEELLLQYKENARLKRNYEMTLSWIRLESNGGSLANILLKKGISKVAIYGLGQHGMMLAEELKKTDIKVEYAIDRRATTIVSDIPIYDLTCADYPCVDMVIVSTLGHYSTVASTLEGRINCPVVELDELLFEA